MEKIFPTQAGNPPQGDRMPQGCERNQINNKEYIETLGTPPSRGTPLPCEQALKQFKRFSVSVKKSRPDCVRKQLRLWWITNFLTKTLCQTPIDAKSRGSSFCRKAPLNLQNEDPYLNALSDANRREIEGLRFVEKTPWIYKMKTLTKTLCQTSIDAKSRGSSFCRKDPLNLQNEDPCVNALSDANRRELKGVFIL